MIAATALLGPYHCPTWVPSSFLARATQCTLNGACGSGVLLSDYHVMILTYVVGGHNWRTAPTGCKGRMYIFAVPVNGTAHAGAELGEAPRNCDEGTLSIDVISRGVVVLGTCMAYGSVGAHKGMRGTIQSRAGRRGSLRCIGGYPCRNRAVP